MYSRTQHLLFIDESGTYDMRHVDPNWPVFVLVGLLVGEKYYAQTLVPRVKQFKRNHGLSHKTVLHSRDIRRWEGPFGFLSEQARRESLYADLNALFQSLRLRLYVVVIDKARLAGRNMFDPNPYDVSLNLLLSLMCGPRGAPTPWPPNVVRIVAERRGKAEDKLLQKEFQWLRRSGLSSYGAHNVSRRRAQTVKRVFPERIDFAGKSKAIAGLELADLAAYPVGRAVVSQRWGNPAYVALSTRIRALVVFP